MSTIIPFGQVGTTPSTKGGGRGWGFYQAGKIIYQSFSYMYIYIYICKRNHYYKDINFKLEQ